MTAFRSRRVVRPGGTRPADVVVQAGRIDAIEPFGSVSDPGLIDLGELALLPGLVDTHVHVDEPGRTSWEGFATATKAAAAGGVTTLIDMPLNCLPPTTTVESLAVKRAAAEPKIHVDVGFWGGAAGGDLGDLEKLHAGGVFGFKAFLSPSGVPEFGHLVGAALDETLAETARLGALCVVHAEAPEVIDAAPVAAGPTYARFLASRPPEVEHAAVARLIEAARRTSARVHVVHVSSAGVLPLIAAARSENVAITAETCPHYLFLTAADIADGDTSAKCCPPIREAANRDALWLGLASGVIDVVVSDHSPCPPELKTADFATAWGGVAGLQVGLPAVWTQAKQRGFGLTDVARWMSTGPAALAGLVAKGAIEIGRDADLVAFDPDAEFVVDSAHLHHRHAHTPYAGRAMSGVVQATWLRGELVDGQAPRGEVLERRDDHAHLA